MPVRTRHWILVAMFALILNFPLLGADDTPVQREQVVAAMNQAATFYRQRVAAHGGYVYFYTLDLKTRWGEGLATPDQIWVQPPATPTVGMAFLKAWRATGDRDYLDAAREAAEALAYGQLRSGGWQNSIDMAGRKYGQRYSGGQRRKDGTTSLDDGQTQSAIQFVALADEALEFRNATIHESAVTAVGALLAAQFPNGGFPQGWKAPVAPRPVLRASYPEYNWRSEGRIKNYWDMYTLNDNVCGYVADTLITVYRITKQDKYKSALERLGDFLILAQMPDPQPAWAQQYNYDMKPIWARKFEPPGISGDESQEVIETLMKISAATENPKYLEPIPRAIAYLERSLLPDGQLARYYELKTNKPLYMVRRGKQYSLTYNDADLPGHYGWKTASRLAELKQNYRNVMAGRAAKSKSDADLDDKVRRILGDLDDHGRWVSTYNGERLVGQPKFQLGSQYISSEVFSENIRILSAYLLAEQSK